MRPLKVIDITRQVQKIRSTEESNLVKVELLDVDNVAKNSPAHRSKGVDIDMT